MKKLDLKKQYKDLYSPSAKEISVVKVPRFNFIMVSGQIPPIISVADAPDYQAALETLYGLSYTLKFMVKRRTGTDWGVMPLEGLWWADDYSSFTARAKDEWRWTMMIMAPDFITRWMFEEAVARTGKKLGSPPSSLRLEPYDEGLSVQILHFGSYDDEAPTIKRLHEEFIPQHGLTENGLHHEIYLSDPRKTEASKLKTILRQPVRRI